MFDNEELNKFSESAEEEEEIVVEDEQLQVKWKAIQCRARENSFVFFILRNLQNNYI